MEQKVIMTKSQADINDWLEKGWKVISVTPQHVGTNTSGCFCFVIERS
jgi:hypothetical protein